MSVVICDSVVHLAISGPHDRPDAQQLKDEHHWNGSAQAAPVQKN